MKTCYYEILGVPLVASQNEIRSSYKQKALLLHPDKNTDKSDEFTKQFQLLGEAYECLSNPQERAYYDAHRLEILRGGEAHERSEDTSVNIWKYFSNDCFTGYSDEEGGFYKVFDELFKEIHAAEMEEEEEESPNVAFFGTSQSSREDVQKFYNYWSAFTSCKSFANADEILPNYGMNRRESRFIAKHNSKLRTAARKQYSESIRALVMRINRKDKRVIEFKRQKIEEKVREENLKQLRISELKQNRREERVKQRQFDAERWEEIKKEREELLREGVQGFHTSFQEELDEERELTLYVCVCCDKRFKSEKQFLAHEKSKKHIKNVQMYLFKEDATQVEVNNEELNGGTEGVSNESEEKDSIVDLPDVDESENLSNMEEVDESNIHQNQQHSTTRSADEAEVCSNSSDENQDEILQKLASLRVKEISQDSSSEEEVIQYKDVKDVKDVKKDIGSRVLRGQSVQKKKQPLKESGGSTEWKCEICAAEFPTRNKLFQHISKEGHAALKTVGNATTKKKRK